MSLSSHQSVTSLRASRLRRLEAARVYACSDARAGRGDLAVFAAAAFSGGVDIVQVRDKGLEARAEIEALRAVAGSAARAATEGGAEPGLVAANDRADVAVLAGADVFHVGQGDLTTGQARAIVGPDVLVGRSTHSEEQIREANDDPGLDYFCVGPVWETPTKPGREAVGLDLVRWAASVARKPWFAIGGIDTPERAAAAARAGAERIVAVRALAEDPAAGAAWLRKALDR